MLSIGDSYYENTFQQIRLKLKSKWADSEIFMVDCNDILMYIDVSKAFTAQYITYKAALISTKGIITMTTKIALQLSVLFLELYRISIIIIIYMIYNH